MEEIFKLQLPNKIKRFSFSNGLKKVSEANVVLDFIFGISLLMIKICASFLFLIWLLWFERNSFIHKGRRSPSEVLAKASEHLLEIRPSKDKRNSLTSL